MLNRSFCFILLLCLLIAPAFAGEVTIYRDTYGIPHVYADTDADAAYGLGYAQAEDRLEDIYENTRIAIGQAAEFFGPDAVQSDYIMRVMENEAKCKAHYEQTADHLKELSIAYIAGVEAFAKAHPERVPEHALKLEPWHPAAVGRAMILKWPIGTALDEIRETPQGPAFSSNCFAVAPERTADGDAILLTDPHLTWESLAVFHEARVHGDKLHMCGYWIAGSPLLALGHNGKVGWAMTTGGPDTTDIYTLEAKLDGFSLTYQYEGESKAAVIKTFNIKVKGEDEPRVMPVIYTMHGPVLAEPDPEKMVLLAAKSPYWEDLGYYEQAYEMCIAQDSDEYYAAISRNSMMEQNNMFADTRGNIGYVRIGKTPIRPEGFDWSRPVPGDTKATEWQGVYDLKEHVQLINPEAGYMQNCNISPENMLVDSPLTPDKFPEDLYNVSWDTNNPRGKRMTALLHANDKITTEDAIAITMDIYDIHAEPWKKALKQASAIKHDPGIDSVIEDILAWNGEYHQDSTAAPYVWKWRLLAQEDEAVNLQAIAEERKLSAEECIALMKHLEAAADELRSTFEGKDTITWGDTHVVGRSGTYYPYDGADYGKKPWNFSETVRDVDAKKPLEGQPGVNVASGGCMSTMLMFMREDGIEAYTTTPWGVSAVPDSPHHTDQARELFSKRRMKPAWFKKADLMENLTTTTVIQAP